MALVGEFPGAHITRRRTIRAHVNPMDKSTVVSIYPRVIDEKKPTIQPGEFHLEAGSYERPALLVVGSSSWWRDVDDDQPLLEIPQSSVQVAESIVRDYANSLFLSDMDTAMPGLFWVPGSKDIYEIRKEHTDLLDRAMARQRNWFHSLVKAADLLWVRSGGAAITISDDMRLAARELNLENKEWLRDAQIMDLVRCVACGFLRNPQYPMCSNCKTMVDVKLAAKLGVPVQAEDIVKAASEGKK